MKAKCAICAQHCPLPCCSGQMCKRTRISMSKATLGVVVIIYLPGGLHPPLLSVTPSMRETSANFFELHIALDLLAHFAARFFCLSPKLYWASSDGDGD